MKRLPQFVGLLAMLAPLALAQETQVSREGGAWVQVMTGSLAGVKNLRVSVDAGSVVVHGAQRSGIDYAFHMRSNGSSEEDARPVRAFDFHLPEQFADGGIHRVAVTGDHGENLQGSPLVFVAFANEIGKSVSGSGESEQGRTRAELLDRLVPMSIPFSDYQAWRARKEGLELVEGAEAGHMK